MIELKKLGNQFLKEMNDQSTAKEIDDVLPAFFSAETTVTDAASISMLILKANSLTFSVQAREQELRDQGFFTRMLKGLTGSNTKMRSENIHDVAAIGYLATQMINQLLRIHAVTLDLVNELHSQNIQLAHAIINIQNDINKIAQVTLAMELYHIANKMPTPWKARLIELPPLQRYFAITLEFFARNTNFYGENTVFHYTNALESVNLDPQEKFSVKELAEQFQNQPELFRYLDSLDKEINLLLPHASELREAPNLAHFLAQRESDSGVVQSSKITSKRQTFEGFASVLFQELTSVQMILAERREILELEKFNKQRQLELARQEKIVQASIQADHLYRLCNIHGEIENNLVFCGSHPRYGINLEWRKTRPNIKFINQNGDPIVRYGTPVSIFFDHLDGATRTLAQSTQKYGVQIGWYSSSDLRFEWVLVGGAPGEPVPLGSRFILAHVAQGNLAYTSMPGDMVNLNWGPAKLEWCVKK